MHIARERFHELFALCPAQGYLIAADHNDLAARAGQDVPQIDYKALKAPEKAILRQRFFAGAKRARIGYAALGEVVSYAVSLGFDIQHLT